MARHSVASSVWKKASSAIPRRARRKDSWTQFTERVNKAHPSTWSDFKREVKTAGATYKRYNGGGKRGRLYYDKNGAYTLGLITVRSIPSPLLVARHQAYIASHPIPRRFRTWDESKHPRDWQGRFARK